MASFGVPFDGVINMVYDSDSETYSGEVATKNGVTLYNNIYSGVPVLILVVMDGREIDPPNSRYYISLIDNYGMESGKAALYSNGNLTCYIDSDGAVST